MLPCLPRRRRRSPGRISTAPWRRAWSASTPFSRPPKRTAWRCGAMCPVWWAAPTRATWSPPTLRQLRVSCTAWAATRCRWQTPRAWGRPRRWCACLRRRKRWCQWRSWQRTCTTPTARRSPTSWRRCSAASPSSTPPSPAWAGAPTRRAPPATWPPRTWCTCWTALASSTASTCELCWPPATLSPERWAGRTAPGPPRRCSPRSRARRSKGTVSMLALHF
mmetsp:Transcript_33234/g.83280  ORF Transcript_33234/g.83280 Transcript_33234/m.83280 type:complete len:221 (+) Transcript_33234:550-1212(+)